MSSPLFADRDTKRISWMEIAMFIENEDVTNTEKNELYWSSCYSFPINIIIYITLSLNVECRVFLRNPGFAFKVNK